MKSRIYGGASVAAAIVIVAFLLRVIAIGEQELWYDEAFSFEVASAGTGFSDALRISTAPPLYYLLLRAWIALVGSSESALRFLSACLGTLAVASVIVAGRQFFNKRVGLWSGAVAALSPIHIYYSQETRMYALLTLALLWTYILLWRALESNTRLAWIKAALAAVLAVYTHYVAVFGLLPAVVLLSLWPTRSAESSRTLRFGTALLFCALCVLPWIIWSFVLQPYLFAPTDYIRQIWVDIPPAMAIPKSLEALTVGPHATLNHRLGKVYDVLTVPPAVRWVGLMLAWMLAAWAAIPWGDERLALPWLGRRKAWLWSWLLLPLAGLWLMSLYKPVYIVGRYDMIAFPAAVLLGGFALAKLQSLARYGRVLAACAALALFSLIGWRLVQYYEVSFSHPTTPSNRATARVLSEEIKAGDAVILSLLRGAPILYYFNLAGIRWDHGVCTNERTGARFACRLYPPENETWFGIRTDAISDSSFARSTLASLGSSDNAMWVVADPQYITDALFLAELGNLNLVATAVSTPEAPGLRRYTLP